MRIIFQKNLDMDSCYDNYVITCVKQGDNNRYIEFVLMHEHERLIPDENDIIEVWFRSPDGNKFKYDTDIIDGKVLLKIDPIVTALNGVLIGELRIKNGNDIITSPAFKVRVKPSIEESEE